MYILINQLWQLNIIAMTKQTELIKWRTYLLIFPLAKNLKTILIVLSKEGQNLLVPFNIHPSTHSI